MREILFRGRRVDNNEWVYGWMLPIVIDEIYRYFILSCGSLCPKDVTIGELQIEVKQETIGQYTGLTDKNGVKIFEEDKVKYNKWVGVVKFNQGAFYIEYKDGTESEFNTMTSFDLEVVGNIHDK